MKKLVLFLFISFTILLGKVEFSGDYHFKKVASNVYTLFGPIDEPNQHNKAFSNNPTIVIDKLGVILIDPSGSQVAGEYVLKEMKKITKLPVIAVFNTHIHGDHWLGNQAVIKHYPKVKIYAHPTMISRMPVDGPFWVEMMLKMTNGEVKGLKAVGPNNEVVNEQIIQVGSQSFKIHNPIIKSHTNTDIMIEHINSKTLIAADNLFVNRFGMFGEDASILGNIEAIKYAKNLNLENYIPGHGEPKNIHAGYQEYFTYLTLLYTKVKENYDEGVASYEIKNKILDSFTPYHKWIGFDIYFGKHIDKMYREIEENDI